jgi:hypothetical protein
MSHPNPYLFQISILIWQDLACSRMDNQQVLVRTRCRMSWTFKDVFTKYRRVVLYCCYTNAYCCIRYSFECIQVVNFNVSSTKINAHT